MIGTAALVACISGCRHAPPAEPSPRLPPPVQPSRDEYLTHEYPQLHPIETRLQCTLSVPASVTLGDPIPLTIRLHNRSDRVLRIARRDGPLNRSNDSLYFHADCDGTVLVGLGAQLTSKADPILSHQREATPGRRRAGACPPPSAWVQASAAHSGKAGEAEESSGLDHHALQQGGGQAPALHLDRLQTVGSGSHPPCLGHGDRSHVGQ